MYAKIDLSIRWEVIWENEKYFGIGYDWFTFIHLRNSLPSHIRVDILGSKWKRLKRRIEYEMSKRHGINAFALRKPGYWKEYIFQQEVVVVDGRIWEDYEFEGNPELTWEDVMNTEVTTFKISCSRPPYQYGD